MDLIDLERSSQPLRTAELSIRGLERWHDIQGVPSLPEPSLPFPLAPQGSYSKLWTQF